MKKVKTITIILAIILVTLVAFVGVYVQTQNRMENKVKNYALARELEGERLIELKVVNEDGESVDGLTLENYETVRETIENRLKKLGAQDYTISLNKEDGTIRVELTEDDKTDMYAYYLTASRKIQIKEKDTETELLGDSMIKKATYNYSPNVNGEYQVYMQLELTKEGQARIEEIQKDYALLATEIEEIEAKAKDEEESTEAAENTSEAQTTENVEEQENVEQAKKIAVLSLAENEYDIDKIEKNKITIKIGSKTTNTSSVNNYIALAAEAAMLINAGQYPIEYEIENNRYVYSDITKEQITYFAVAILIIVLIVLIAYCIKYKISGLLASISYVGFIAVFSLILRYTNVIISIEGIGAIILTLVINLILNKSILSKTRKINMVNEAIIATYKDIFLKLVPIMIITLVFCFAGWTNLSSFGMIMFWGLILVAIYNVTVTRTLLKLRENK